MSFYQFISPYVYLDMIVVGEETILMLAKNFIWFTTDDKILLD